VIGTSAGATAGAPEVVLPRRPVLTFWLIAVALEILLGVVFLVSGAESAIDDGLAKAGIGFGSDLLTAGRVVVAYPAALLGVTLALAQVASPDEPPRVWWRVVISTRGWSHARTEEVQRRAA
jgi:hypothetical protein